MLANNARATVAPGPTTTPSPITNATTTRIPTPATAATTSATNETTVTSLSTPTPPTTLPHTPFPVAGVAVDGTVTAEATNSTNPVIDITIDNSFSAQSNPAISALNSDGNDNSKTDNIGPVSRRPKARPGPSFKPILLSADRRNRKKKSIRWQSDDNILKVHHFELIADERTNVAKNPSNPLVDSPALSGQMIGPGQVGANFSRDTGSLSSQAARDADPSRKPEGLSRREWRLILIDYNHYLPGPGWNSVERSAQAERETYVLGAIDLPGQPSTLDEPDGQDTSLASSRAPVTRNDEGVKIIPLDNPEGMYAFFPDPSGSEIVNGVLRWTTGR